MRQGRETGKRDRSSNGEEQVTGIELNISFCLVFKSWAGEWGSGEREG